MISTPLVSITMPVYNGERTIQLAIKSILYQTYKNWECIIVNDGSTDGTAQILAKYENNPRFKIIHLPVNKGRSFARQVALDNAEGEFLTFLDADDIYHPKKLELQISAFHLYPELTLCSTGVGSFDNNYSLRTYRGYGKGIVETNYKSYVYPGFPASCMIKMQVAKSNSYDIRLNVGEDNDFIRKCLTGKSYYVINEILYFYEEIGLISKEKLMQYQIESLKTIILTSNGITKYMLLTKGFFKLLYKFLFVSKTSISRHLLRRGKKVSDKQIYEFNELFKTLNK
jgi:glycosyltransferase involved in cell wall biosynthesis